jgi:hypothetical protein
LLVQPDGVVNDLGILAFADELLPELSVERLHQARAMLLAELPAMTGNPAPAPAIEGGAHFGQGLHGRSIADQGRGCK